MASSDKQRRPRFLPSIGTPSTSDDVALTLGEQGTESQQGRGNRRTPFKGFRNLFSSDRSARSGQQQSGTNLPSVSIKPSSSSQLIPEPNQRKQLEKQSSNSNQRSTNPILRDSEKKLISVESNLQSITGESCSAPGSRRGSCSTESSRSCSPWEGSASSGERSLGRGTNGTTSPTMTLNIDSAVEVDQGPGERPRNLEKSLSDSGPLEVDVILYTTSQQLKRAFKKAKSTKDYPHILQFLTTTFNSFATLGTVFKASDYETKCGINTGFVNVTYDIIMALPSSDHRKAILKSIVNCLLNNIKKKQDNDVLPGYLVLLQNPQFNSSSSYVIFSHLLRQVSSLSDKQHHELVGWMGWLPISNFKSMVNRLKEFVTITLFPRKEDGLPSPDKLRFWVPSAVKVLALLNAANWLNNRPIISYKYMYIEELEQLNLPKEYDTWQSRSGSFSFCQYPFLLSLAAKRFILEKDSEAKMIEVARRSLIQGVKKREAPAIGMLFLNLKVRRDNLISDSLNEITRKSQDLKKKLKVTFVGEPGVDMGGLTKEWFMLLVRKIFRPEYGMFRYDDKSSCYWFINMTANDLSEFHLVGILMGLAVYNSTILDIRFPLCCYKKLLSPVVVPSDPNAIVGVSTLQLSDLKEVMPDLAKGLQELLNYDGNVEEDMCQTFQVSTMVFGSVVTENLKENGDTIPVTNENRLEYVNLYVDYLLNKSIYRQFAAFYRGFHSVCASNALIMLRPEEVEMLVCGNPDFDMRALSKVTTYDGFSRKDVTIRYFWEIVGCFSSSLKRKLLRFCTGSDRIPVGGMREMDFKITRMTSASEEMLPMAHTCFNQLCLPPYKSRQVLKTKLTIAISNAEGFGIE